MAALPNAENVGREIQEIERRISDFKMEIAQANGSLDTVRNRVTGTQKDLKQDKYRKVDHGHRETNPIPLTLPLKLSPHPKPHPNHQVDDEHRKMLIKCKTTHFAVKDLDNYYKALDRALMKFHSSKMESINKSIKELWNKTYKVRG